MVKPKGPVEVSLASEAAGKSLPCLKGKFPFQLATTSYILPAALLPNIRFLGRYVDEVELVLFESNNQSNLPTPQEVREMVRLASDFNLTYNVHLPGDLFLGDPDPTLRREFCAIAVRFYERTLPLDPTSYTLHLDSRGADGKIEQNPAVWQGRVSESLETLRLQGLDLRRLVVENLEYPLERLSSLAVGFGLGFCLDVGHLLLYRHDVGKHIRSFLPKSAMVHLHGVNDGHDHRGLDHIPSQAWNTICRGLKEYRGVVSLEVFSLEDLIPSLERIEEIIKGA
jgi:sugar phosphate isomerase/epimerase